MKKPTFPRRSLGLLGAVLFSSTLCGSLFSAPLARAEINPGALMQLLAQNETATGLTLKQEDLPAGFVPIPSAVREQIVGQIRTISEQLGGAELDEDNLAVFMNPRDFQVAVGFTNELESPELQAAFDTNIKKIDDPAFRQEVLNRITEKIDSMPNVELEVTELDVLPNENNVADSSRGVTVGMKLQGQPFRVDLIPFRRGEVGAVVGVLYLQSATPLPVRPLADKLDRRIADR